MIHPGLQNRLVGALIVFSLAVIFLPDLLSGKKVQPTNTFVSIPAMPEKRAIVRPEVFPQDRVVAAAERPVEIVDEPALDDDADKLESAATDTSADVTPAEQTAIVKEEVLEPDIGWVIQLGSFRHEKNVQQLLGKLESAGYRAFTRPIRTNTGTLTKVFVGPEIQKQTLDAALPHLTQVTGLKGKVTEFTVE